MKLYGSQKALLNCHRPPGCFWKKRNLMVLIESLERGISGLRLLLKLHSNHCLPSPKQKGTNFRERSSIQQCIWISLVSLKCMAKAFAGNSQQLSSASWALQALQDHYSEIMQMNPQEGSRSAHLPEPSCFLFTSETPYASARVWTTVYVDPTVLPFHSSSPLCPWSLPEPKGAARGMGS